ncbi:MAG: hypothetical protein ACFFG0_08270 [Candidatus Thorarchaeota archaeon]
MSTNKESVLKWARMIKPSVELEECVAPGRGFYKCFLIKEVGINGVSFSADTYTEFMQRVNEIVSEIKI